MKYYFLLLAAFLFVSETRAQNNFTGPVGIGTTTPSALLHVNAGNIKLTNPPAYPWGINLDVDFPDSWTREISISQGGTGKMFSFGVLAVGKALTYGYIGGNTNAASPYLAPWMTFKPNGYVGIGTLTPSTRLTIETGDSTESNFVKLENKAVANSLIYLGSASNSHSVNTFRMAAVFESYRNLHISAANATSNIFFETGRVDGVAPVRMVINNVGNVGIGTTTPGPYKLAVEGTIGARRMKVTQVTPWADFVFAADYKLPTIQEVEDFINMHQHLPEIPSAAEVVKDGIDLGEMNQKLLQKIEEQMLYIIEMNKKINVLTNEVKDLKEKVSAK
ncbi:hypothetical protein [Chitinophaga sp.]|uniref:hypothetical protein n=1 Tax=Chitinophaga sp. TaxID=1869181 RepID=UPI002F93D1B1